MDGISVEADALVGDTDAEILMVAFADQLSANFGGIRTLEDWGKKTLRTRCRRFRLAEPDLIPFTRYAQACRRAGITVESSWASLLDMLENAGS